MGEDVWGENNQNILFAWMKLLKNKFNFKRAKKKMNGGGSGETKNICSLENGAVGTQFYSIVSIRNAARDCQLLTIRR